MELEECLCGFGLDGCDLGTDLNGCGLGFCASMVVCICIIQMGVICGVSMWVCLEWAWRHEFFFVGVV